MSIAGSIKGANADKGVRYVSLLDQALCNGNWDDVPELTRKLEKHAPGRECELKADPRRHDHWTDIS